MKHFELIETLFVRSVASLTMLTFCVVGLADDDTFRVYILAGQSNMEGQGVVDLDHPQYYNGGKGILKNVMLAPETKHLYKHIKNGDAWVVRDDVWVRFKTRYGVKAGGLTIGFTGYEGNHHIGPEFQIGHVLGQHYDQPVLLIKTAWGGKSLHKDFRPPSAEGETGEYYTKMVAEVREALAAVEQEFPQLKGLKPQLAGFIWFQGWNDMFDENARNEYEQNLVSLIRDVRKEFDAPGLPVVIGELGNGGDKASPSMQALRAAQKSAAAREGFKGNVVFTKTTQFARPAEESPNVGHGHHWFGNAESYFLIGDALGKSMLELERN